MPLHPHLRAITAADELDVRRTGGAMGAALHEHLALHRLAARFGTPPPLNLWVRTAVSGAERTCWRIELLPAITRRGGVELGADLGVCTVSPEQAAAELRTA